MAESAEAELLIVNARGLHARAATKLVQIAGGVAADVTLVAEDGQSANAKSVMGVLLLCCAKGSKLVVRAVGEGAVQVVEAISLLVKNKFGEPE